jgi:hypothetical protein
MNLQSHVIKVLTGVRTEERTESLRRQRRYATSNTSENKSLPPSLSSIFPATSPGSELNDESSLGFAR